MIKPQGTLRNLKDLLDDVITANQNGLLVLIWM